MPTYEYVCAACGHALEIFHSMSEAPRRKCPACGKSKLERRIGRGAGILFKGSGFYQTDYRSDSYKQAAESGTEKAEPEKKATPETSAKPTPAEPAPKKPKSPSKSTEPS